jgi:hypothetical protein
MMISEAVYLITIIVIGGALGLLIPDILQFIIFRILGGEATIDYTISLRPIDVEFHSVRELKDWQIRLFGASKLVFLALLILYLFLYSPIRGYEYSVFAALMIGTTTISPYDILALQNPYQWSMQVMKAYFEDDNGAGLLPNYLPSVWNRPATYISSLVLSLIVFAFFLEHQRMINLLQDSNTLPYDATTLAQIIGGIGSVVFPIILIILYDKQAAISEAQSQIQEEQAELMRREREPQLSGPYNFIFWGGDVPKQSTLGSSTSINQRMPNQEANPNSLQFFQTNAGEGLALNFKLIVTLDIVDGPHVGNKSISAVQRIDRFPLHKFGESDLQGGEMDVGFVTESIELSFTDPNPNNSTSYKTYELEEGINRLHDEGTNKISLTFYLSWQDEFEENHNEQVFHVTSGVSQDMDLLDLVNSI